MTTYLNYISRAREDIAKNWKANPSCKNLAGFNKKGRLGWSRKSRNFVYDASFCWRQQNLVIQRQIWQNLVNYCFVNCCRTHLVTLGILLHKQATKISTHIYYYNIHLVEMKSNTKQWRNFGTCTKLSL